MTAERAPARTAVDQLADWEDSGAGWRVASLGASGVEIALLACVATAHRREAYTVSLGLVEEIKAALPVWKRQLEADGATRWIGA